jgi:hypothetical protein
MDERDWQGDEALGRGLMSGFVNASTLSPVAVFTK